jgi:hypothetical protein
VRRTLRAALAGTLFALAAALPAAAKIDVHATVEPTLVGLGETTTLTIEVTIDRLSNLSVSPKFELENLEIAAPVEQANDMHFGSGGLSRTFRSVWRFRPAAVGTAAVRKITIEVNGTVIPFPDREIRVQRTPTRPPDQPDDQPLDPFDRFFGRLPSFHNPLRPSRQPDLFLREEVEPRQAVVGQQVLYTVYLYSRRDVQVASPAAVPGFKGFWVRDIPQPQRLQAEFVEMDGQRYARVAILRKALFPIRPGSYTIEPTTFDFAVREVESTWFGPPIAHDEPVRLSTQAARVEVTPLPPAPPGFTGAVGDVSLLASLAPQRIRVGEASTLTLTLVGAGNLQGVADPSLKLPPGIEATPPQHEGRDSLDGLRVQGQRRWTFAVVPKRTGSFAIKPPPVPYFDPGSRQFRTAAAMPLTLSVLPPAPVAAAGAHSRAAQLGSPNGEGETGGGSPLSHFDPRIAIPWTIAGLSTATVLLLLLRRKRPASARGFGFAQPPGSGSAGKGSAGSGPAQPPGAAAIAASAHDDLRRALAEAASESRPRALAQRLEEAWRAFFARRLGLPPEAGGSRWLDQLAERGLDPALRGELAALVEDLRYLRQAPQLASIGELQRDVVARSERLSERFRGR